MDYLCIGQGVDANGKKSASAETRVRVRLPPGKHFDRVKEATPATVTLFNLMLHDTHGRTEKLGRAVTLRGQFEVGKAAPRAGHNIDANVPKGELVREVHINLGNSGRAPSSMKIARGKKIIEHYMLCQWE